MISGTLSLFIGCAPALRATSVESVQAVGAPPALESIRGVPLAVLMPEVELPLRPDEIERLREAVHGFLSTRSPVTFKVIPLQDLRLLEQTARMGLARDDGPRCAVPMSAELLITARYERTLFVRTRANCSSTACSLSVSITHMDREAHAAAEEFRWQSDVSDPQFATWIGAVDRLVPAPREPATVSPPAWVEPAPHATGIAVESITTADTSLPVTTFTSEGARLLSLCVSQLTSDAERLHTVVEFDEARQSTRCFFRDQGHTVPRTLSDCVCSVMFRTQFVPPNGDDRVFVSMRVQRASPVGVHVRAEAPQEEPLALSVALGSVQNELAKCQSLPGAQQFSGSAIVQLDPQGFPNEVLLSEQSQSPLALRACVDTALRSLRLTCRLHASVEAPLRVRISTITLHETPTDTMTP